MQLPRLRPEKVRPFIKLGYIWMNDSMIHVSLGKVFELPDDHKRITKIMIRVRQEIIIDSEDSHYMTQ